MIKLERTTEPEVLERNKVKWLTDLDAAVQKYGSYARIPKDEKSKLTAFYRHEDIKAALGKSSYEKCAFCESKPGESGNIEVEHFAPKSIHHKLTFTWSNLLPCCRLCNGRKGVHDTALHPIVNPYVDDPQSFFYFRDISLRPKLGPNYLVAKKTIEVCGLDGTRLMKPRAELLLTIRQFISDLEIALNDVRSAPTSRALSGRLRKIREAIDRLDNLMLPSESHSNFIRSLVEDDDVYKETKQMIDRN